MAKTSLGLFQRAFALRYALTWRRQRAGAKQAPRLGTQQLCQERAWVGNRADLRTRVRGRAGPGPARLAGQLESSTCNMLDNCDEIIEFDGCAARRSGPAHAVRPKDYAP